jgi:hypothetical protein
MTNAEMVDFTGSEGAARMLQRAFPQWPDMTRSDFERLALAVVISAASRRDVREELKQQWQRRRGSAFATEAI